MYHTPPTKSSRNHTEYDEDDDNGETREEDIGNVESNEKGRESGRFVDMCDTATKDETNTDGSSNAAEHVGNIRPSHFGRKPLRQSACWFYAHGRCRSGDNCHFSHDGPLNRKGKARARRDSASAYALSSWNSGLSEDSDIKEETRKTKKRAGTFANPQEGKRMMQGAARMKAKVEANEKRHRQVHRNDICMMMGVSQESSYTVPEIRPARNGTSSFGLDEQPPIKETDGGRQGLDENVLTDNGSRKVSSGLEEIRERTTTAVQNGGTELVENPNFKKNELNRDREVMTGAV